MGFLLGVCALLPFNGPELECTMQFFSVLPKTEIGNSCCGNSFSVPRHDNLIASQLRATLVVATLFQCHSMIGLLPASLQQWMYNAIFQGPTQNGDWQFMLRQ